MEVSKGFLTSSAKVLKEKCAWICNIKILLFSVAEGKSTFQPNVSKKI